MTCTPIQHFIRVRNIVLKGMTLKMQQSEIIRLSKPFCRRYRIVTATEKGIVRRIWGGLWSTLDPNLQILNVPGVRSVTFSIFIRKFLLKVFQLQIFILPLRLIDTTNIIRITVWYSTWYSMIHTGITSKTNLKVIQSCVEPLLIV